MSRRSFAGRTIDTDAFDLSSPDRLRQARANLAQALCAPAEGLDAAYGLSSHNRLRQATARLAEALRAKAEGLACG